MPPFVGWLKESHVDAHARLMAARVAPDALADKDESNLLIELARPLEDFLAALFGVAAEAAELRARHNKLAPVFDCKRLFVQRYVTRAIKADAAAALDGATVTAEVALPVRLEDGLEEWELAFATAVRERAGAEFKITTPTPEIEALTRYAAWALHSPEGKKRHRDGPLFKVPHKLDFEHLVPIETEVVDGVTRMRLPRPMLRHREGFALTDEGFDLVRALDHSNYCIWCHNQGKDSCSRGLKDRKTGAFQKSPFGVTLAGCPLEEKISEMNLLKSEGFSIGALAMAAVDNPLVAATGHRICNDCMKACIYQKQEPVDIPQIETRTLKDVLGLPWGFEIYSLLTRWNPLNLRRPIPRPATGRTVLVVGLGPAGFNLAHHLMNDGHAVVGIDGLKIEPLPVEQSGVSADGARHPFAAVRDTASIREDLGERAMAGFGGVAEYGITVRWDKNYLKMVRLLLERRGQFSMFGGVRFGGTVTVEDAFAMGFDHVALCAGAGKPTVLDLPNGLARGVRAASDFLMALQLTGAAKKDSIANLQIRLPVVVIGGGLTAIDTATELLAYYPLQVEKFLARHEILVQERGLAAVFAAMNAEEREIAGEFIAHAEAIRAERVTAEREGRTPDIAGLVNGWGGVTIAYRRRLIDSPSYTLNHEEVLKALEEDIRFAEGLSPVAVEVDANGHATGAQGGGGAERPEGRGDPAGAHHPGGGGHPAQHRAGARGRNARLHRRQVLPRPRRGGQSGDARARGQARRGARADVSRRRRPLHVVLRRPPSVLRRQCREGDGRRQAGLPGADAHHGDAAGVQALAGRDPGPGQRPVARQGRARRSPDADHRRGRGRGAGRGAQLRARPVLSPAELRGAVEEGRRHLAHHGGPGADRRLGRQGQGPAVADHPGDGRLVGPLHPARARRAGDRHGPDRHADRDRARRDRGAGGRRPGQRRAVLDRPGLPQGRQQGPVLRGLQEAQPTATRSRRSRRRPTSSSGPATSSRPSPSTGRRTSRWSTTSSRPCAATPRASSGEQPIPFKDADRIVAIGSDGMMNAVRLARHGVLKPYLKADHRALGSINSPMQCMMKEICAQCLQLHKDPVTGKESVVFSCFNQDQELDRVDFACLRQRLRQNGVQEKIGALWIDRSLRKIGAR